MQNSMKNRATSTMHDAFIHDDHAARAHDGADAGQRIVIDAAYPETARECIRPRAAGLHGLELPAVGNAAADVEDDFAQRDAHGDFDQAGVVDSAGEGEDLGAFALVRADARRYQLAAVADDGGDVGEGLNVVDQRGRPHRPDSRGERRSRPRRAALAFDRGDQRGFFAADEGARADADLDVES